MDTGHYNCRDYAFSPHLGPTAQAGHPRHHHESFDELEARSRSPASQKPRFPLLRLPLELRQQILRYLLPHTQHAGDAVGGGPLGEHARNFSAVKKRQAKGMYVPVQKAPPAAATGNNVVWRRGNTRLLGVCRQLHRECADLLYGTNAFLLFVTYADVTFRYRWLLPSGMAPTRNYPFLDVMPERYRRLIRRVVVNIDHVDSYTGMLKFNVSGKGLAIGMRNRVQSLVNDFRAGGLAESGDAVRHKHMSVVSIRLSNYNAILDGLKCSPNRLRDRDEGSADDVETIMKPFLQMRGVRHVSISGVDSALALQLEQTMRSMDPVPEDLLSSALEPRVFDSGLEMSRANGTRLCVYGNDI